MADSENNSKSINSIFSSKYEAIVLFILLLFLSFYQFFQTGFTTNDDTVFAVNTKIREGFFRYGLDYAIHYSGRFNHIIVIPLLGIPYLFDNWIYYKFISLSSIILNISLFSLCIRKFSGSILLGSLTLYVFVITLQNSWEHNLVSSYPFVYHFGFSLILTSLLLLVLYLEENRLIYLIGSILAFSLGILMYEIFILYFIFVPFVIGIYAKHFGCFSGKIYKVVLPFALCILFYLVFYFGFRIFYPSHYDGNQIAKDFSFFSFIKVIIQYSVSSFPTYIFHNYSSWLSEYTDSFTGFEPTIWHILSNLKIQWAAKAIISGFLCYRVLKNRVIVFDLKKYFISVAAALTLFFLPNVLMALTAKYQHWVDVGSLGFTGTYFSFFGVVLFLASTIIYLNQLFTFGKFFGKVYILLIVIVIAVFSLKTDYSNYFISKSQVISQQKWKIIDLFFESNEFKEISEKSLIYSPSLWNHIGIVENMDYYWSDYVKAKTGKSIQVTRRLDEVNKIVDLNSNGKEKIYFLKYSQATKDIDQFIVFSEIKKMNYQTFEHNVFSNEATIFVLSKNKKYNLFFNSFGNANGDNISLDGQYVGRTRGGFFSTIVDKSFSKEKLKKSHVATGFSDKEIKVNFKEVDVLENGFFGLEGSPENNWRWCSSEGELELNNPYDETINVKIETIFQTPFSRNVELKIHSPLIQERIVINSNGIKFNKVIAIPPGSHKVHFFCDGERLNAPGDNRHLVFLLRNFRVENNFSVPSSPKIADFIILDSISLSYFIDYKLPEEVQIIFHEESYSNQGFYSLEKSSGNTWRWCSSDGTIELYNKSMDTKTVIIEMVLQTGYEEQSNLLIEYGTERKQIIVNSVGKFQKISMSIPPGSSFIKFTCDGKKINAPNDPRNLVFRVMNLRSYTASI